MYDAPCRSGPGAKLRPVRTETTGRFKGGAEAAAGGEAPGIRPKYKIIALKWGRKEA
jgi:hypothetical protein